MCSETLSPEAELDVEAPWAVEARDLTKIYQLYEKPADRLKQMLFRGRRTYYREYAALSGLSFSLRKGDVLGIIGRNGAGKSTLLQLLCGTLTPTQGELSVHGRIAALLELGAGFNPLFTGRENVYLSGALLGLSEAEIDTQLESIIDFSGIREFIDQPVSTYSSGMYVRLAFSVATSVDPDVLVIDEALSVGDGDFARRSFERIMAMRDAGKTILFCSHSLYQVEMLCNSVLWLDQGCAQAFGSPDHIVPEYQAFLDRLSGIATPSPDSNEAAEAIEVDAPPSSESELESESNAEPESISEPLAETESAAPIASEGGARLVSVVASADGNTGKELSILSGETDLTLQIRFRALSQDLSPRVAVAFHHASGQLISSCGNWVQGVEPTRDAQGYGELSVTFERLPLLKGRYNVGVLLFCERGIFLHDEADPVVVLQVSQSNAERGVIALTHRWCAESESGNCSDQTPAQTISSQWSVGSADEVSQQQLLSLFHDSFGYHMPSDQWRWKYRFADVPGTVAYQQDRLVSFIGGMPRSAQIFGQPAQAVQMGDVMVAPACRGILSKKGPFYQAMRAFISEHVGPDRVYSVAFGFPHQRAYRLGIALGLYCEVDRIQEAAWTAIRPTSLGESGNSDLDHLEWLQSTQLSAAQRSAIDVLWEAMQKDLAEQAVGVRDSRWIQYRYLDKPGSGYALVLVAGEREEQPFGLLVLKDAGELGVELLDIIAPRAHFEHLLLAARRIAAQSMNKERLFAWCTPSVAKWMTATDVNLTETEVVVPGSTVNDKAHALRLQGRWWLMGGDADFR